LGIREETRKGGKEERRQGRKKEGGEEERKRGGKEERREGESKPPVHHSLAVARLTLLLREERQDGLARRPPKK
jgi:hypothetical protein